jgi:peptidylprolyl isomerase
MRFHPIPLLLAAALLALAGCAGEKAPVTEEQIAELEIIEGDVRLLKHSDGIWYHIISEGDGPSPEATSKVQVHYTGWLPDGKKFDSSRDRGQPVSFQLDQVIDGWSIGVADMQVGERRLLVIPAELGYGEKGAPPVIPPGANLLFDVELISILPEPRDDETPISEAELQELNLVPGDISLVEGPEGLRYHVIEDGGGATPAATDQVKVHYTGWLTNGHKFDSSRDRGEPAVFPLNRVIKGWTLSVSDMNVGGRRLVVIPWELAYGEQGRAPVIPPKADLVFDIKLMEIVE